GLQVADALDVEDGGAMDTHERAWIEPVLETGEGLAREVHVWAGVDLHVVAGRLHVVDVGHPQDGRARPRLHDQAFPPGARACGEESGQANALAPLPAL